MSQLLENVIVKGNFVAVTLCCIFFQENLKKFREEKKKLETSDAIKKARQKFVRISCIYYKSHQW